MTGFILYRSLSLSARVAEGPPVVKAPALSAANQLAHAPLSTSAVPQKPSPISEAERLQMSEPIRILLGLEGDPRRYNDRTRALNKLTRRIAGDDLKALRLFLEFKANDQKELSPIEFNALKNDVMDILLRQDRIPEGLGRQFAGMAQDPEWDDVWRDYCLQYLPQCYDAVMKDGTTPQTADERQVLTNACWSALAERGKTLPGTALLGLERMSRKYPEVDRQIVGDKAVELAADEQCLEASRITSLRICGMLGRKEALPSARVLAQAGETIPLRMAAIATVGDLGDPTDIDALTALSSDAEKRLQPIAVAALNRLTNRPAGAL